MDNEIKTIQEDSFKRKNHLLDQFADNGIEKSISEGDFEAKYGQGHQVFTMAGINKFVAEATGENPTDEVVKGIEDELSSLSKVVVKTENGYESRFVREEKEAEAVSKGEEDDASTEASTETATDAEAEATDGAGTEAGGDEVEKGGSETEIESETEESATETEEEETEED